MKTRFRLSRAIILGLCLTALSCSPGDDVTIQGSGATFPAPLYKRWFLEYYKQNPKVRINYQAIGSGAGIRQFEEGLPAFAATDAHPRKTDAVMKMGVYLLPMTAGSVAVCYYLPDGPRELKLSRAVYPSIFLGKITMWNDPRIAKDNPGATLPATPITVVRRADSSGTTFAFTNHLNSVHAAWKKDNGGPGAGKSIQWPTGLAGRGNSGVAAIIQLTPGAIGYTETSYAELAKLEIAHLENREGFFVLPTPENNLASLSGPNLTAYFDRVQKNKEEDSYNIEITDPEGRSAYPIVTYTWMIVSRHYRDEKIGTALKEALAYCLTDGQKISPELGYIPLPEELVRRVLSTVRKIKVGEK